MNNDKVTEVLRRIALNLAARGHTPFRAATGPLKEPWIQQDRPEALRHAHWMCLEALTFPEEKLEKKMRWLGFVQGVLWSFGIAAIEELKRQNMPDEEKT
jgi:hypothetical protein